MASSETTDFDEEYTTTDLQLPADMPGFDDDYEAIVAKVDDLFKVEEKTTAREDVEETMTTCKKTLETRRMSTRTWRKSWKTIKVSVRTTTRRL